MARLRLNHVTKHRQWRNFTLVMASVGFVALTFFTLLTAGTHREKIADNKSTLEGVVNEAFEEANAESALLEQQAELEQMKQQLHALKENLRQQEKAHQRETTTLTNMIQDVMVQQTEQKGDEITPSPVQDTPGDVPLESIKPNPTVHMVAFDYKTHAKAEPPRRTAAHYVPSGTFVRAVVLGGADADASVNGQSKNNGVMLFKLVQPGTLPNGARSYLEGCFVTASSYGDISSERAYVVLDRLSCAKPGEAIIDKAVTGWVFFEGKVGIKGKPMMRDNKIMRFAGLSGALSGIASAAQYSQSVQSISPLGSATTVPTGNIAPYAAYGGASKAADVLSSYYIKRAEQYHPVIQVGSGNLVTIVFKEGFYLDAEEKKQKPSLTHLGNSEATRNSPDSTGSTARVDDAFQENNFTVPPEVLRHIEASHQTF